MDTVYIVGIATDFTVAWTALDAVHFGFKTYVIEDACKAIDLNGSLEQAWQEMSGQGFSGYSHPSCLPRLVAAVLKT